jgi:probable addiction module antidote protein
MDELTQDYKEFLYERLEDPAEAAEYLNAALDDEDISVFLLALRDVVDVCGVGKVAKSAALNRENLYRILSDQGNPRLSSLFALLKAVGVQLQIKPPKARNKRAENAVEVQPRLVAQDEAVERPRLVDSVLNDYRESAYGSNNTPNDEPAAA